MKKIIDTDAVELTKVLKECDRLDLINVCHCWYQHEVEVALANKKKFVVEKEKFVEKILQDFPEKIVSK